MTTIIKPATLQFLNDLKSNNNREWFNKNKLRYEDAKQNYLDITQQLAIETNSFDKSISANNTKEYIFRIYRDIRFSHDKTPYKTNFGIYLAPGGRKSGLAGYYLHIEPSASFVSGGVYMVGSERMKKVRTAMSDFSDEFLEIVNAKSFKNIYQFNFKEDTLSRVPQGFSPQSQVVNFLKLKNICPHRDLSNDEITNTNALEKTVEYFVALHPLIDFFNKAMTD